MAETGLSIVASYRSVEAYFWSSNSLKYGKRNPELVLTKRHEIIKADIDGEQIRISNQYRAQTRLRRLIDCNFDRYRKHEKSFYPTALFTLTFAENRTYLEDTNSLFTDFSRRLSYHLTDGKSQSGLKYIAVPEFQKRGAVHYHVCAFNMGYVEKSKMESLWGHGFVDIRKAYSGRNLGRYLTKYLHKNFNDSRYDGNRKFFPAKGLFKPEMIYDPYITPKIIESLPKDSLMFERQFYSRWVGWFTKRRYLLPEHKTYENYFDPATQGTFTPANLEDF